MNKDFGNRLWGFSWGTYYILFLNYLFSKPHQSYSPIALILNATIIMYFGIFGVSRFTPEYRKIL